MADAYVDLEQTASTATSPYETWAKAAADLQTAITQAGSGGRVFVRIDGDGVGTTKDTASGSRTLSFPGTDQVPFGLYGVKDATTAEPPTDSDSCVRGTDTLPVYETTGGGNILLDEASANSAPVIVVQGTRIDADGGLDLGAACSFFFVDSELDYDADLSVGSLTYTKLYNSNLICFGSGSDLRLNNGLFEMVGGLVSGTAPTIFIDASVQGRANFYGVDLSLITGTLLDIGGATTLEIKMKNCKLATGVTRITGTTKVDVPFIELIGSSDETGLGSGESVRDYAKEWYKGTVLSEATFVRTGGANDGVADFSYALTPRAASTKEGLLSIETPWFGGIVEGDASTSKDFTIYIANSSGADLTDADCWVEILYPSEAGTTDHGLDISSRSPIDASPSTITDDTASDWSTGAGGKNAQKIVITKTPDFTGPVYARVHFAQAGTNTLYVDPKIYVTDT